MTTNPTGKPAGVPAVTPNNAGQTLIPLDTVLELLDTSGLAFVMHTHHPLTHISYGEQAAPTDPWALNARNECPEIMMEV